jgi:hypothetical protein
VAVRETADATKQRYGAADLPKLLKGARRVVVSKGKKSSEFELAASGKLPPELAGAVLGPTGNLRAPTLRVGTTWLVGFHGEAWSEVLG